MRVRERPESDCQQPIASLLVRRLGILVILRTFPDISLFLPLAICQQCYTPWEFLPYGPRNKAKSLDLRILVYLVTYDSGQVFLAYLLLSWSPSHH